MNGHLTPETVAAFFARHLPAAEMVCLFEHIEDCEACGKLFREARNLHVPSPSISQPALADVLFDDHLEDENLVALAANMLDGKTRKLVERHLQSCVRCRENVRCFLAATRNREP
ncbi:MAG: zf-HC2 domain-containing protein, partial [Acidobacteriota bacterium]|nr:zf-HC2 domain-containing protein [Acidobacteriota bacterium]